MSSELKGKDVETVPETATENPTSDPAKDAEVESDDEDDHENNDEVAVETAATSSKKKKKKSKKKKIKALLGKKDKDPDDEVSKLLKSLSTSQISELLAMNPALARELGINEGDPISNATDALKNLKLHDIMSGLAASGKNAKDIGSYKFWQTQPVPKFEKQPDVIEEGPFKVQTLDQVPKEPSPLLEGFEWVTMDLTNEVELKEVYELLSGHYVEDQEAMFRFNYSASFLKWALLAPGWTAQWHVGVRTTKSKTLVAFISGVPMALRVRDRILKASEINFLCVHKKLRSQRLTPVLIKEITRRCNLDEVWQAIYTAGIVLPTPVTTCRYFHRALDWQKLYEIGFSPCPSNSKPQYQVRKYALPDQTTTKGLRPMEEKDIDAVLALLRRYLARFDMAPVFTRDELKHWAIYKPKSGDEQVIWSYVVEDPTTQKITDFFSFYSLASTVIGNTKHRTVNAAYLFYYATETAFEEDKSSLKKRLNELVSDALILAKREKFDVFNALTLLDNCHFLEQQKFGAGDGQLHFYLYNYRANPIAGGVDRRNQIDENCSGVGVVML